MKIDLSGRVAIVTGSGRGIGKAIASMMAESGANVVINDVNFELAKTTAKEIADKYNRRTVANGADVTVKAQVDDMIAKTVQELGGIDILVNNAGTIVRKPAEEIAEAEYDKVVDVNVKGVFLCSQAVFKPMVTRGKGKIISIASVMGLTALPPRSVYCASKAAVIGLTRDLAVEWAKYKINVNAIAPGWIKTEFTQALFSTKEAQDLFLSRTPMGRFGETSDITPAAVFLASDQADFITGHTLVVDGGWCAL
ncbi:MAG: SDR family NAD(P)-dependent oxidoreductase [Candidatus Bathyarchaeia archaeon]